MPADPWGTNNVDATYSSAPWSAARVLAGDPLAAAASVAMVSGNSPFFFTSHTFTHQNLNNATSSDSTKQVGAEGTVLNAQQLLQEGLLCLWVIRRAG